MEITSKSYLFLFIPQIAQNITRSNTEKIPAHCPVCQGETRIEAMKDAKVLYCTNPNCEAKRGRAFVHFVSRDAMNIQGFSKASIEKFIDNGFIHDFADVYHLVAYEEDIKALEGFGQKSYDRLIASIETSRNAGLPNFIYALGIEQIGINNAKLICQHFDYEIEKIMSATEEELVCIDGIGSIIAHSLYSYFRLKENKELIDKLVKEITFVTPDIPNIEGSPIANKTFVVTGSVHHFKNRKELGAKIEELGGKVVAAVSKKTDFLINNDTESLSSKNKRAKELEVPIISEDEFIAMI